METPSLFKHPVLRWYYIALLALMVALLPLNVLFNPQIVSLISTGGTAVIVSGFGLYVVIHQRRS